MKIKQYENQWHNINFIELDTKLSLSKLAGLDFYNKFYEEFFIRYNNFNDLSENWKSIKIKIAEKLEKKLPQNSIVLSYGCGIGFIEKFIVEKRKDLKLDCFDFSDVANKWLKRDLNHIYFTSKHKDLKKYDYIFMVGLMYAIDDLDAINLIKEVKYFLKKNGKIIIINSSSRPYENGVSKKSSIIIDLINFLKNFLRPVYYSLFRKKNMQLWGYKRDKKSYEEIFKKAGLNKDESFSGANQLFQIFKI